MFRIERKIVNVKVEKIITLEVYVQRTRWIDLCSFLKRGASNVMLRLCCFFVKLYMISA
jgi:hypothetical protein